MNIDTEIKNFEVAFKKLGDQKWGKGAKKYLKSPFYFYGVKMPDVMLLVKDFYKRNKDLSEKEFWTILERLWDSTCHEKRLLVLKISRQYASFLNKNSWPKLEKLLKTSMNWDQVDDLSTGAIGLALQKDFVYGKKYLIKWSQDKNFWLRRASLISQLLLFRKKIGDKKLFFTLAEKMLDESKYPREYFISDFFDERMGKFFIRKAIGWTLRELGEHDPQAVVDFLNKNKDKLSGLSWREGSRRLPKNYQNKLKK